MRIVLPVKCNSESQYSNLASSRFPSPARRLLKADIAARSQDGQRYIYFAIYTVALHLGLFDGGDLDRNLQVMLSLGKKESSERVSDMEEAPRV